MLEGQEMSVDAHVGLEGSLVRRTLPRVLEVLRGYGILLGECFERAAVVYPVGYNPIRAGVSAALGSHSHFALIDDLAEAAKELNRLAVDLVTAPARGNAKYRRSGVSVSRPSEEACALSRRCERLAALLRESPLPDAEVTGSYGELARAAITLFAGLSESHGDILCRRWPALGLAPGSPKR